MKQAVRYIYWVLVMIYFISVVIFFFKMDISNYIMDYDPIMADIKGLTYEEYKNSIKAQELIPKIYMWCMYYSFAMTLITFIALYCKIDDSSKTLKRIFFISLFWTIFLFIVDSIHFIPTRGL